MLRQIALLNQKKIIILIYYDIRLETISFNLVFNPLNHEIHHLFLDGFVV